jgi:acyl carrier protein
LWGGLIDLPADADGSWAAPLLAELSSGDGEDQIALRGGIRYGARLARAEPLPAAELKLHGDASYLITGGLGSVGLQMAQWLVAKGARHIVLTGRTTPAELPVIEGCRVSVRTADVSCREQVAALLDGIEPPLRGVIHAAGVLAEGKLGEQSQEAFESVLAPKVRGGWHLHELTQDCALDFFVCVSSIAAVWGSPEQGAYAAANAYLDGLASYRRQRGLPGLSVSYGPWGAGGMADRRSRVELARRGVRSLGGKRALSALGALWGTGVSEAVVADVDWPLFRGVYEARRERRLLVEMAAAEVGSSEGEARLVEDLEATPLRDRRRVLERHLRGIAGKVLGIAADELDPETGFADLGMDSLMAVELRKRLQKDVGRAVLIPTTVAFDHPSVRQIAVFVLSLLYPASEGTSSEEDLDALLLENLKAFGAADGR